MKRSEYSNSILVQPGSKWPPTLLKTQQTMVYINLYINISVYIYYYYPTYVSQYHMHKGGIMRIHKWFIGSHLNSWKKSSDNREQNPKETEPMYQKLHIILASDLKLKQVNLKLKSIRKLVASIFCSLNFILLLISASMVKIIVGFNCLSVQETDAR